MENLINTKIGIIGLGYVGLPLAVNLVKNTQSLALTLVWNV